MSQSPRLLVAALTCATLAVSGCGSTSSPPSGGGSSTLPGGSAVTGVGAAATSHGGKARSSHVVGAASRRAGAQSTASSGEQPASAQVSRTSFVSAADGICGGAHGDLRSVAEQLNGTIRARAHHRISRATYYSRIADLTERMGQTVDRTAGQLRGLPRPRDPRIQTFISLFDTQGRLFAAQVTALRKQDAKSAAQMQARLAELGLRSVQLARVLGMHTCAGR